MTKPRLVLCNSSARPELESNYEPSQIIRLSSHGNDANVNIRLEDVARVFQKHLSDRLVDLIEIASFVYSTDCATSRGSGFTNSKSTESWHRDFEIVVPVRDLAFWSQTNVQEALRRLLLFLSDDEYSFQFVPLLERYPVQKYLEFSEAEDWPFYGVERVLMFSGGLDSLAGALETAIAGKEVVLVSHRPVGTISKRQQGLFRELKSNFSNPMLHIPVWINKDGKLNKEPTQRTRSFLYGALGVVVAQSLKASGVTFFENGIVSLNLPVADEVLRARASRTTHPLSLEMMEQLYRLIVDREFVIDNPYIFDTKGDIVRKIANTGYAHLIGHTCSCAHTIFKSLDQQHCGTCSQCIDRRVAVISSDQAKFDPETDYEVDVFTGTRKANYEHNIAVDYVRHATNLSQLSDEQIGVKFNTELSRAARPFSDRRATVNRFIDMHKRHGDDVCRVLSEVMSENVADVIHGRIPRSSLLASIMNQEHLPTTWKRFSERIAELLTEGVPVACRTNKPKTEPDLQEICDGLLRAADTILVREFPFMRWSSSSTKPDWSSDEFRLWVELKYVRKRGDIRGITEAIAADITKYSDNGLRVLFVIYDPEHHVVDEVQFATHIVKRDDMSVHFIR